MDSYYSPNLSPSSIHHHMSYTSSLAPSGSTLGSITPPMHSTAFSTSIPPTPTPSTSTFSLSSSSHNNNTNSTTSTGTTISPHTNNNNNTISNNINPTNQLDIDDLFLNQISPYNTNFTCLNLLTPSTTTHQTPLNLSTYHYFPPQTPISSTTTLVSLDDFNPSSMSSSSGFDQSFSPTLNATRTLCSSSHPFPTPTQTDTLYSFPTTTPSNNQYYTSDFHSNTLINNHHNHSMIDNDKTFLPLTINPLQPVNSVSISDYNANTTLFTSYLSTNSTYIPVVDSNLHSSVEMDSTTMNTDSSYNNIEQPAPRRKKTTKASKSLTSDSALPVISVQPPEPVRRGRKPKAQLEELRAQQQAKADLVNSFEIRIEKLAEVFEKHLFSILGPNRTFHLSRASNKLIRTEIRTELMKNNAFLCDFQTDQTFIQSLLVVLFPPATAAAASSLVSTATLAATSSMCTVSLSNSSQSTEQTLPFDSNPSTNFVSNPTPSTSTSSVLPPSPRNVTDTYSTQQVQPASQPQIQISIHDPILTEHTENITILPSLLKSNRKRTYSTLQKLESANTTSSKAQNNVQSDTEVTHKSSRIRHTSPLDSLSPSPTLSATETSSRNHPNALKGRNRTGNKNMKMIENTSQSDSFASDSDDSSTSSHSPSDFVSLMSSHINPSSSSASTLPLSLPPLNNGLIGNPQEVGIERLTAFEALNIELQRLRLEHSLQQQFILYQHKTQQISTPTISRTNSTLSNTSRPSQVPSVTCSPSLSAANANIASTTFHGNFDYDETHPHYIEPLPLTSEFSTFVAKNRFQLLQSLHVDSMLLDSCVQSVHDSFEKCLE